ncbi:SusF/SusE family outer membrane protein [Marinigracilibium pacificum]|uniref:SusF/SusE family outer membrane protein n=1 Tax=Marinigracilibium pacificum TaxID=2729599 RepID=A0A848J4I6_9BACT|nr:SusF/SusE family outer membrane protein [Marinigracilibium pacificum]NMM48082.1 SusF/SusE family outer membrane protein [Marinigracilibium pacificum]
MNKILQLMFAMIFIGTLISCEEDLSINTDANANPVIRIPDASLALGGYPFGTGVDLILHDDRGLASAQYTVTYKDGSQIGSGAVIDALDLNGVKDTTLIWMDEEGILELGDSILISGSVTDIRGVVTTIEEKSAIIQPVKELGIIGDATPGGWGADTDLQKIENSPTEYLYRTTLALVDGQAKFRMNDDWAENYGGDIGIDQVGTQDGPNIPISEGTYLITMDYILGAETQTYSFKQLNSIGIIGSATPEGWNADQNMTQESAGSNIYSITLDLVVGEIKFRADDDWTDDWGGSSGNLEYKGGNIAIAEDGNYTVSINFLDNTYTVTKN